MEMGWERRQAEYEGYEPISQLVVHGPTNKAVFYLRLGPIQVQEERVSRPQIRHPLPPQQRTTTTDAAASVSGVGGIGGGSTFARQQGRGGGDVQVVQGSDTPRHGHLVETEQHRRRRQGRANEATITTRYWARMGPPNLPIDEAGAAGQ